MCAVTIRLLDRHDGPFLRLMVREADRCLAVAPPWRRRGIGRRLLGEATARARALGHAGVSLSVMPDNPALGLYASLGFRKVGDVDGSWTMLLSLAGEPQTPAAGMHQPLGT